jgi:hypothetical protein
LQRSTKERELCDRIRKEVEEGVGGLVCSPFKRLPKYVDESFSTRDLVCWNEALRRGQKGENKGSGASSGRVDMYVLRSDNRRDMQIKHFAPEIFFTRKKLCNKTKKKGRRRVLKLIVERDHVHSRLRQLPEYADNLFDTRRVLRKEEAWLKSRRRSRVLSKR